MDTVDCRYGGGTGKVQEEIDTIPTLYGKHQIGRDWEKIDNVYIWFEAFHRGLNWRGIPGYVYQKPDGSYVAPFRGELIPVTKDARNEFRQTSKPKE